MGNSVLLGQRLIGSGKISQADLERALEYQQASADRLGAILVRFGAISEESLLPVLAEQTGYSLIASQDIAEQEVLDALDALQLSADWARQKKLLVWREQGDWHAASRDPLDLDIQDDLACRSAAQVHWHFVRSLELEQMLAGLGMGFAQAGADAKTLREMAEDAPTISLVNSVIAQAIDERASDVHFEPGEHQCQVRFRVDGVLHARQDFSMDRYPAVSSRLKLIADLDIAERRLPQDGRTTVRAAGSEMDLRVSVVPATWGESIVLRLLPKIAQLDADAERHCAGNRPDRFRKKHDLVRCAGRSGQWRAQDRDRRGPRRTPYRWSNPGADDPRYRLHLCQGVAGISSTRPGCDHDR